MTLADLLCNLFLFTFLLERTGDPQGANIQILTKKHQMFKAFDKRAPKK